MGDLGEVAHARSEIGAAHPVRGGDGRGSVESAVGDPMESGRDA